MIKDVLVHVEPGIGAQARLEYAIALARSFSARLSGLAVTLPPAAIPFAAVGDAQMFAAAAEAAVESANAAKAQFEKFTASCGLETDWRGGSGIPLDVIRAESGCADLLIVGREDRRDLEDSFYTLAAADVVMACSRPVLVLPDDSPKNFQAKRILVAWKSTPEAARAAHDAMPFLTSADEVALVEIFSPGKENNGRYCIPVDNFARHLQAHQVPVKVLRIAADSAEAGNRLIRAASDIGADLIVAGAYGHSRLRELVLGGVTSSLLHTGNFPCLLSH